MKNCDLCNEPVTPEVAIDRRKAGRFSVYPGVRVTDGRSGHAECFIREGVVSIGNDTGAKFVDQLDACVKANIDSGFPPPGFTVQVVR